VSLLRERLRPARPVEADQLARLITALDSKRFAEREMASAELAHHGEQAVAALRDALKSSLSPEARRRVEQLVTALESPFLSGSRLQAVRVSAILERIGTAEARQLLREYANGASDARLTKEACASLSRLAHNPRP
jgi:hypothetical protein